MREFKTRHPLIYHSVTWASSVIYHALEEGFPARTGNGHQLELTLLSSDPVRSGGGPRARKRGVSD
jgi:hypothetical protein